MIKIIHILSIAGTPIKAFSDLSACYDSLSDTLNLNSHIVTDKPVPTYSAIAQRVKKTGFWNKTLSYNIGHGEVRINISITKLILN